MSSKVEQQKNVFFMPGMFAGVWIWNRVRTKIKANISILHDPLCYLSDSIDELCDQLSSEINKIPGKVSLVGNSLGSLLALKLASIKPNSIEAVVISGAPGFGQYKVSLKLRKNDPQSMRQNLIDVICHNSDTVNREDADRVVTSFAEKFRPIIRLANQSNKTSVEPIIEKVECRIYAIWGRNDVMTPIEPIQSTLDRHKIKTYIINNCGHSPMYEKPDEFAAKLSRCLLQG